MKRFIYTFIIIFIIILTQSCDIGEKSHIEQQTSYEDAIVSPAAVNPTNPTNTTNEVTVAVTISPTESENEIGAYNIRVDPKESEYTLISECSTPIIGTASGKMKNIRLAVKMCDGLIIKSGEEFSFNRVLGPRTMRRGYQESLIIVDKKKKKGVGGGICQVSSTIYGAVLNTTLDVTERHEHGLPVLYAEKGKDATVSYGRLDFKFKNSLDRDIKIEIKSDKKNVTVKIYKLSDD